jgi:fused signal recognition particle receptor
MSIFGIFGAKKDKADPQAPAEAPPEGWLGRLKSGLTKSSSRLTQGIGDLFTKRKLDDEALEDLQDLLITADLGVATAGRVTARLAKARFGQDVDAADIKATLAEEITAILAPVARPLEPDFSHKPHVVLVVGVNGSGKTTTIGKLAKQFRDQGRSVLLAAGDTFRAAAVEQLKVWGDRTGCPVIARETGSDSAGLAFDALAEARRRGDDLLFIDTAGRLQNKADLMEELRKVVRVIKKQDETAPHDVLLVLDATVGQNAHSQVEVFKDMVDVSGLVLTKLDGTARGGVLVALAEKFALPVHAIGIGEKVDDLRPFEAEAFARSLVGLD